MKQETRIYYLLVNPNGGKWNWYDRLIGPIKTTKRSIENKRFMLEDETRTAVYALEYQPETMEVEAHLHCCVRNYPLLDFLKAEIEAIL